MEEVNYQNFIQKSAHPCICFTTLFFKGFGISAYIFLGLLLTEELNFVLISLAAAFDFWFIKQIAGRKLVKLHWELTSESAWDAKYISAEADSINWIDEKTFWYSLYICPIVWLAFGSFSILSFNIFWTCNCALWFILSTLNLYHFRNCSHS